MPEFRMKITIEVTATAQSKEDVIKDLDSKREEIAVAVNELLNKRNEAEEANA